jgi:predicted nucleic acid-binding protein
VVLADSSAWILASVRPGFFEQHVQDEEIATCPPVIQEYLQGTGGKKRFEAAREMFLSGPILDNPVPLERYEQAAWLFLRCRTAGFTIRKNNDLLIAATAMAHDVPLLHNDDDFDYIARVVSLRAVRARV